MALYLFDGDSGGRAETINILDAATGNVLDTRTQSNFAGGTYVVYSLSGHVQIQIVGTAGPNAVISGIFFGGTGGGVLSGGSGGSSSSSGSSTGSGGSSSGNTNNDPALVVSASASAPAAVTTQQLIFTGTATGGTAPLSYSWHFGDGTTSTAQDPTHSYTSACTCTATFTVTDALGQIAEAQVNVHIVAEVAAAATFLGVDTSTGGQWWKSYGAQGENIVDDSNTIPSSIMTFYGVNNGVPNYAPCATWNVSAFSSPDLELQMVSNPANGIAAECYSGVGVNLNFTDGQPHQVAFYIRDYFNQGDVDTVQATDAATGIVLDTEPVSDFANGEYLTYNLSGNVNIIFTAGSGGGFGPSAVFLGGPVQNSTPVVTAPTSTAAVSVYAGVAQFFALGSVADAPPQDYPGTLSINWGDGTTSTVAVTQPGALGATHTYASPGTYHASVQVANANGLVSQWTTSITTLVYALSNPNDYIGSFIATPYLIPGIPNFCRFPTTHNISSGNWSNPVTWSTGVVPVAGDVVSIEPGTTVTYDANSTAALNTVCVQNSGTLTFNANVNTQLYVQNLLVFQGATLNIGTQANPIPSNISAQVVWVNQPLNASFDPEQYGNGLIALGTVNTYGAAKLPYVTLAAEPHAGNTSLSLVSAPTGWQVGDNVRISDTRQMDNNSIASIVTGANLEIDSVTISAISGNTVTLATPLLYDHLGGYDGSNVLQELPQVVNMTRNVKIHSQSATGSRGYALFTANANVDLEYSSFTGMGRTKGGSITALDNTTFDSNGNVTHVGANEQNRNAITFLNLVGPATPQPNNYQYTFNNNVVTCPITPMPFAWGINLVNSFYGLIQNNDVVNWNGSGIMADGISSYNNFNGNFIMEINGTGQRGGGDVGMAGNGFWMGNPKNYVTNNIVSDLAPTGAYGYAYEYYGIGGFGELGEGFVNVPAYQGADPSQPGQSQSVDMNLTALLAFNGNEAYGVMPNAESHWWVNYNPNDPVPPLASGGIINNFTVWNVMFTGIYSYQETNITVNNFKCYGNAGELAGGVDGLFCMQFQDYENDGMVVQNSYFSNAPVGVQLAVSTDGRPTIYKNSTFVNAGIGVDAGWGVGANTSANSRVTVLKNDQFYGWSISFGYWQPFQFTVGLPLTSLDQVFVCNSTYNGTAINVNENSDLQAFYSQQAADFVIPNDTNFPLPIAGLTNQQAWAQFGVAMFGAVAPANAVDGTNIGISGSLVAVTAASAAACN